MNKTVIRVIVAVLVILLFIPSLVIAQDKEKEDIPYWYVMYTKVAFAKMDSLVKFRNEFVVPIIAEAKKQGSILDNKLLLHHTGTEYTVVFMIKYPSWCAIEGNWMNDALNAIEPDKDKRKVFWDTQSYLLDGFIHYDEIYTEP